MTTIHAVDDVVIPAPPDVVWDVIADVGGYVRWWPKSVRPCLISPATRGIGGAVEIAPQGGRAFRCEVIAAEAPLRMTMRYGGANVSYTIDACAGGWLVKVLSRFLNLSAVDSRQMKEVFGCLRRESARQI